VLPGLEQFCADEVRRVLGRRAALADDAAATRGAVRFRLSASPRAALELRTAVATYAVVAVPGRRPSALLGDTTLFDRIEAVRRLHPPGTFSSFRLSAPGRDSSALHKLREALSDRTGLLEDPDDGGLFLRIRRRAEPDGGWEALVRLSPRPLSARPWRRFNLPGALNATIAAAMVELTRPGDRDRVLNLMCGSGTILVERVARGPAALAVGCDLDPVALAGTRTNLDAAGVEPSAGPALARMDATALPLRDGAFDVLLADLPYGHRMGSHEDNASLYPAVLAEAARVTEPGGVMVVVTHELRLFERSLREAAPSWSVERGVQVFQKGHHPVVYLLRRMPETGAQARSRSSTSSTKTSSESTTRMPATSRGSEVSGSGRPARMARSTRTKRR
jgi:23S rRNA G2445 N2-methylase RlmL